MQCKHHNVRLLHNDSTESLFFRFSHYPSNINQPEFFFKLTAVSVSLTGATVAPYFYVQLITMSKLWQGQWSCIIDDTMFSFFFFLCLMHQTSYNCHNLIYNYLLPVILISLFDRLLVAPRLWAWPFRKDVLAGWVRSDKVANKGKRRDKEEEENQKMLTCTRFVTAVRWIRPFFKSTDNEICSLWLQSELSTLESVR